MTQRKVEIADELWATTRLAAFSAGRSAGSIVVEALGDWHKRHPSKLSVGAPHSANPPKPIGYVTEVRETESGIDFDVERTKPVFEASEETVGIPEKKEDPWRDLNGQEATTAGHKLIETPQEAAAVAAKVTASRPEFRPVPKPSASKSRSSSKTRSQAG